MIVGLCGRIGSGKSTVANILKEEHGFAVVDLSEPIREALLGLDPLIPTRDGSAASPLSRLVEVYGWDGCKRSAAVRRLLQRFGKDCVRDHLDDKHWERRALSSIYLALRDNNNVVVRGVRFPEERTLVEELWLVHRPDYKPSFPDDILNHPTESGDIDSYAVETITNGGDLPKVRAEIERCMAGYQGRTIELRGLYGKKIRRG